MEILTKENFWDKMEQKYPKAMAHFKEWVDKYKSEHDWEQLFNGGLEYEQDPGFSLPGSAIWSKTQSPKYHELPVAMQFGIFCKWLAQFKNITGIAILDFKSSIKYWLKFLEDKL